MSTKNLNKYLVGYTKKIGGRNIVSINANSKTDALKKAKDSNMTGSNFTIMKEFLGKGQRNQKIR